MSRGYRLKQLLQQLDVEIDDDDDEQFGPSWSRKNRERTVHKDELEEICDRLGYDVEHLTVTAIRELLRNNGVTRSKDKSPQSEFSETELSDLQRAVKHAKFLDAEDILDVTHPSIDPTDSTLRFMNHQSITVNGTEYDVCGCDHTTRSQAETYDAYTTVLLDDKTVRLTLLHNYENRSYVGRRKHGARIDIKSGVDPYSKWKQDEWVESFEFDTSMRERFEQVEVEDVIVTDEVQTELTVINVREENGRKYVYCESKRGAPYRLRYDYYRNALWMKRTSDNENFGALKSFELVE